MQLMHLLEFVPMLAHPINHLNIPNVMYLNRIIIIMYEQTINVVNANNNNSNYAE